jgi:type II secretory pathway component PulF
MSFQVVPELALAIDPKTWTGAAGFLYDFTSFVSSPAGLIAFFVFVGILVVVMGSLSRWTGPTRLYVEKIPPWSIYRLFVGSIWLFTVATLLRARIPLDTIFKDMLASGIMRPWLAERVTFINYRYRAGGDFGSILLHLNMNFPDKDLVEDLAIFSALPNFHTNLYEIAKEYLDDGIERISKQAKILNVVALCSIAGLVCMFFLAFGSIQQQFGSMSGGM